MGIFGGDGSREDYLALDARVAALDARVAALEAIVAKMHVMSVAETPPLTEKTPYTGTSTIAGASWESEARALKAQGNVIGAIKIV